MTATWHPAHSATLLSAEHNKVAAVARVTVPSLIERLAQMEGGRQLRNARHAASLLPALVDLLPCTLSEMASSLVGLQAASYDRDGSGPTPWCWLHQRDVKACEKADLMCGGEQIVKTDPTGRQATDGNPATAHLEQYVHAWVRLALTRHGLNYGDPSDHLTAIVACERRIADLTRLYPKAGTVREPIPADRTAGPGDGWCKSCWRVREIEPEGTRADGRVDHRGECSFCARWRLDECKRLGYDPDEHPNLWPSVEMLNAHAAGKRVTESMVLEWRKEHDRAKRNSVKRRRRKGAEVMAG